MQVHAGHCKNMQLRRHNVDTRDQVSFSNRSPFCLFGLGPGGVGFAPAENEPKRLAMVKILGRFGPFHCDGAASEENLKG